MAQLLTLSIIFIVTIYTAKCTSDNTCPEGGESTSDDKCIWPIRVDLDPISHDEAAAICEQNGGKLPTVKTAQKDIELRLVANEKREQINHTRVDAIYVWINLQRDPLPDGVNKSDMTQWQQREHWKWKDDESIVSEQMWRLWDIQGDEPNNFQQTDELCVVAKVKSGSATWNDATCPDTRWYDGSTAYPTVIICEKPYDRYVNSQGPQ